MIRLGKAFPDMISKEKGTKRPSPDFNEEKERPISLLPFFLILIFCFLLLILRLFYLQIVQGKKYRLLSEENRIKMIKIPALRGIIYDRNKKPLVRNVPIYRVIERKTGKIKIINREEALKMEAEGQTEDLLIQPTREYIYKSATAHLLGYIGEVTEEEIKKGKNCHPEFISGSSENKEIPKQVRNDILSYQTGDFIGRGGVEEYYECLLKGVDGAELVEVDTFGKVIRKIGKKESIAGNNLNLTIDVNLQLAAEKEMKGKKGTVVVQNPETGEILALYSSPSFDPNVFTKDKKEKEKEAIKYLNDKENMPLINRVISGIYPCGSTFKIITSTAGLEDRKITASTLLEDTGVLTVGQWTFPNWLYLKRGIKEGPIDIIHAIKRSNDVFFYLLGEKVGIERIDFWAKKFGLGNPLGIDLPGEAGGLIPNPDWKKKTIGENWYLGDTYHLSIGQGYLLVTPLQVNSWTSVIANGGKLCKPTVISSKLKAQSSKPNLKTQNLKNENCQNLDIKPETIRLITQGMKQACEPGGTGWPLFNFKIKNKNEKIKNLKYLGNDEYKLPVACKTGTAEFGDPENRTHAWFTAFVLPDEALAKSGASEIAVTVLWEAGGEGSDVAAPIAKKILEEWFKKN